MNQASDACQLVTQFLEDELTPSLAFGAGSLVFLGGNHLSEDHINRPDPSTMHFKDVFPRHANQALYTWLVGDRREQYHGTVTLAGQCVRAHVTERTFEDESVLLVTWQPDQSSNLHDDNLFMAYAALPTPVWVVDGTRLGRWFAELRSLGHTELEPALLEQPEVVEQSKEWLCLLNANTAAEAFHETLCVCDAKAHHLPVFLGDANNDEWIQLLVRLWRGERTVHLRTLVECGGTTEVNMILTFLHSQKEREWSRLIFSAIQPCKKQEHHTTELHQLYELAEDLHCSVGLDGLIYYANKGMLETLGYKLNELVNQSYLSFIHPDDVSKCLTHMQQVLDHGALVECMNRMRTKRGDYKWLKWQATKQRGANCILGVAQDVTITQRTARLYEAAEAVSLTGAWEIDLDSGLAFHSKQFSQNFGQLYDPTPRPAEELWRAFDDECSTRLQQQIEFARNDGQHWQLQLPWTAQDHGMRFVEVAGKADFVEGRVVRVFGTVRDITTEMQSKRKLEAIAQREQEMLRQQAIILNALPAQVAFLDHHGTILHANDSWLDFAKLGLPEGIQPKVVGVNYLELCSRVLGECRDDAMNSMKGIQTVLRREQQRFEMEYPCHGPEIQTWNKLIVSAVDVNGDAGAVVMHVNVTQQKLVEFRLLASQQSWISAFEGVGEAIWEWSLIKDTLSVTPQWRAMLGYVPNDPVLSGRAWFERIDPFDKDRVQRAWAKHLRGESSHFHEEFRIRHCKGHEVWVEVRGMVVERTSQGVAMRAVGSQRDITDRVYATRERNAIWHYSQDLICVLDADGRFVRVNPAWQHLLGWHAEDLLATSVRSLVHPDDLTLLSQGLVTIAGASRQRQIRLRLQAKDGRYTWMSWSCFPDEQNQAYFAIARDITEQIQIEAEYRQAQKMEAVGQLAGGVAHDFNNLLTIINGYGELLLKDPQLQPTDREHLLAITHAGDRAANLTRQLLAFSRKSVVVPKVIDVHTIVIDAGKMLTRLIDKNISLKVSLQAVHSHVSIDPGQLEQVLVNLVVNARDAMPSGGTITITSGDHLVHDVPFVEQVDEHFRRFVELSVHDSGRGIDPQHLSKIFEPFFTTKEVGCGTGLGLSMVYGIITQAGGDITVESDLGHGTVFRIFLPTVDAPKDILTETPMPTAPLKLGNILLAEDEESVRSITKIVLERHGFTVLEASTGQRAIELASEYQGPIHLLISDVMMPDTGGRLVAEEVRKLRPDIVVLYMSGFTNNTTLRQGVASQCEAFLQKPFTPTMLIDKVTSLFAANT